MNRFMLPMQLTCLTLAVCTQLYAQDNVVTNSASQTSSVGVQQKRNHTTCTDCGDSNPIRKEYCGHCGHRL